MARKMVLVSVVLLSAFILFVSCKNDTEPTQSAGQTQADSDMKNKTADTTEPKQAADIKQPPNNTDTGSQDQVEQTGQAVPADGTTVEQDMSSGDAPMAFPVEKEYVFKQVPDGSEIVHDFIIQNKGSALLKILKVKAGWGCTTVSYAKEIPPGGQGIIKIKVNTNGFGGRKLRKKIAVTTNDPKNSDIQLVVTGPVETFVTITPKTINITGTAGQEYSGKTEIIPEEKYPFKVTGYKLNKGTNLSLDVRESARDGKTIYSVQVTSGTEASGNFYDKVLLDTDSQIKPVITVWVSVRLQKKQDTAGQSSTSDTTN